MSIHKVERWRVGWHDDGKPRSRTFRSERKAQTFVRALKRGSARRVTVREITQWSVRWRERGRGSKEPRRTFDRKSDAETFEREVKRRKQLGELALWEQRNRTVTELGREWWTKYAVPNLAEWTLDGYQPILAKHIESRLGDHRVGELTPEVVADFRAQLERDGVGRHSVRVAMVVLQAMFTAAVRWGWLAANPVKAVPKPSGKRERAVVCLSPREVEAIRRQMIARDKLYAALIASLIAYQGLRFPEEVLALEITHVGRNTLLVEQRLIKGHIVPGQKVRGFRPRALSLLDPVRGDIKEYLMAMGIRSGLLFPRTDGEPWKVHDVNNWRRRVWHPAREAAEIEPLPPYDLRHAYASLRIRAGASIPELAEELGHSAQMTVATYTHVIRDLQGEPVVSVVEQIERARLRGQQQAVPD